jgi:twitching motility protein PilT
MRSHDLIEYLSMVIERGGSDLHISVGAPPMGRINGQLSRLPRRFWTPTTCAS